MRAGHPGAARRPLSSDRCPDRPSATPAPTTTRSNGSAGGGPVSKGATTTLTPASPRHGSHPLVGLDADDLAATIEEQLRRDAGAAPDIEHTSDIPAVADGIDGGSGYDGRATVVLLGVLTEGEAAHVVHA